VAGGGPFNSTAHNGGDTAAGANATANQESGDHDDFSKSKLVFRVRPGSNCDLRHMAYDEAGVRLLRGMG
jgi:hypothetical protein